MHGCLKPIKRYLCAAVFFKPDGYPLILASQGLPSDIARPARDKFFAAHLDEVGQVACASTGEKIVADQVHMDHRSPMTFEVIVTTFLCSRGMSLEDVALHQSS